MNFYPFHIGDYISHTNHLTDEEDLAYRRMIDLYYQTEKPFPNDLAWIARRAKTNTEVVSRLLFDFFQIVDDYWHNTRADKEIAKYHAMQEGGRKGAALRWSKGVDTPPKQPPMQTKNQEPRTKNQIINTPEGVSESIFKDYLEVRKAKKAKWTETALKGLQREANKAKMSLQDVMQLCCERNWVGFKAEWAKPEEKKLGQLPLGTEQQIAHAYKVECGGDPTKARFNSYFEMRKFIEDFRDKQKRAISS